MADYTDSEKEALLKRIDALEKETRSLRNEVKELQSNDRDRKNELNIINHFIAALTESQSIDEVMTEIESTAKQLIGSENVTFYCMDSVNQKFFSENDGRCWQTSSENKLLGSISDNKEISNSGEKIYIPLVTGSGKTLGIVTAEKSSDTEKNDLTQLFGKGGSFVSGVQLGLLKEYEHQGRITDELTQMYNRSGLNEYLENTVVKAMAEGKSVNILLSDIDHFKSVNDTYGHTAGDTILKGTAEVMKDFTKEGADGCFRVGGEEMVTILITDSPEQAIDMAENLRRNIESKTNEVSVNGETLAVSVTASIGIHEMQSDVPVIKDNVRNIFDSELQIADTALYDAKNSGRNRVVSADEQSFVSYLAMKTAEVFIKAEGLEDQNAISGIKNMIIETFADPSEQGFSDIVDALRAYAVQTSDIMPEISALGDMIADKVEAFSLKTTDEISPENDYIDYYNNQINGENVFDIIAASTPTNLISVTQNGYTEFLETDKPMKEVLQCCLEERPFMAISDLEEVHTNIADFAYTNQSKNVLAVEIDIDNNEIKAFNNDFYAKIPLDKAMEDMAAVFPKETAYYTPETPNRNTVSERVAEIKEWAENAICKAAEKDRTMENDLKNDKGAR